MIRTESEYQASRKRLDESLSMLKSQQHKLAQEGLKPEQIKRALDPTRSFVAQISEEIESYQRLKRGEFQELHNLQGIGQLLVGIRIASGLTQRQMAEKLGVHETQVSRDERNEYFGITVERAGKIFEALGVEVLTRVERMPELASVCLTPSISEKSDEENRNFIKLGRDQAKMVRSLPK
jgi:transcriptional regulator with XRE-family HTH domain